jgi:hypothetical protein
MKVTFDQHIGIFEDAVPKEWCESIINIFEENKKSHLDRQSGENTPVSVKQDKSLFLHQYSPKLTKEFSSNFFKTIYPRYLSLCKVDNFVLSPNISIEGFKVQKTLPTEGYHLWHIENDVIDHMKRVMVYTLYLNDIEEGGETEFLIQSKRIKPKQGTICIFPASYTHIHRGNPPLSGEKYIITGWLSYNLETKPNE